MTCRVLYDGRWVPARICGRPSYGWVSVVGLPGRPGAVSVPIQLVML